jgi:hypothetical protein
MKERFRPMTKDFRKVLQEWISEMEFQAPSRLQDGTPMMGKHETEELFRAGKEFLKHGVEEKVVLESTQRVGDLEVRERIYGGVRTTHLPDFTWIDQDVTVRGEDFTYRARCLCSFPKSNGKVRYIVEDNGRLFVQRREQLTFEEQWFKECKPLEKDGFRDQYLQHPFPIGPTTNAMNAGFKAFQEGKDRDSCPFPKDRKDLWNAFREGWDYGSDKSKGLQAPEPELHEEHQVVLDAIDAHNTGEDDG